MKKSASLIFILVFITSLSFGQAALQQGTKTLGGTVSFSSGDQESGNYKRTEVHLLIAPQFTKFVKDNVELGVQFVYQHDKIEDSYSSYYYYGGYYGTSTATLESKAMGVGTLFNFYFPVKETIAPFVGAGAMILINPDQTENKLYTFYGQGGVNIFLTDYAAVNLKAQYSIQRFSVGDSKGSALYIGAGMSYYILND